jgi:hypothetical protein
MTDTIEVTQADREAAAAVEEMFPPHMGGEVYRDGMCDDLPLTQAFARHRVEEREAVVRWLQRAVTRDPEGWEHGWDSEMRGYAKAFAASIGKGDHIPSPLGATALTPRSGD